MVEQQAREPDGELAEPSQPATQETTLPEGRLDVGIPVALRIILALAIGSPLVAAGAALYFTADLAEWAGQAIMLVGLAITLAGFYFSFAGTLPRLDLTPEERVLALRHPSLKPAIARIISSLPFYAGAGYLLFFAEQSYPIYYFVCFLAALYLYFAGVIRYWLNHHTTYFVTDRRAVRRYRFLWLDTTEVTVNAINSISETRNMFEMVTGRGSVVVASGVTERHKVRMREIGDPDTVAGIVRQLIR